MGLCRYNAPDGSGWGWLDGEQISAVDDAIVIQLLTKGGDLLVLESHARGVVADAKITAPVVVGQEIWAAGVTYESSKYARMAESGSGGDFYAKVYVADRPELFMKGTPSRARGCGETVRIRADSKWNVPEPELTALIAATGEIIGYTIGNDMSSRDIEGANPLYLPQAKVYRGSCGLGPAVVPAKLVDAQNLAIELSISRGGSQVYRGETSTSKMKRQVVELAEWLFREDEFPLGVFLLTGALPTPAS